MSSADYICDTAVRLQNARLDCKAAVNCDPNNVYKTILTTFTTEDLVLMCNFYSFNKDLEGTKFIEETLNYKVKQLESANENIGLVWKLKFPESDTTHYLIGTIHNSTKSMIDNICVRHTMRKSDQLLTEAGYQQRQIDLYKIIKCTNKFLNYCFDIELTIQAKDKGMAIQNLDPVDNTRDWSPISVVKYIPTFFMKVLYGEGRPNADVNLHITDWISTWMKGDSCIFDKRGLDPETKERNIYWLNKASLKDNDGNKYKGLLDLLQKTKNTTCIAVGADHCTGEDLDKIIPALKHAGFIIEQLTPNKEMLREELFDTLEGIC